MVKWVVFFMIRRIILCKSIGRGKIIYRIFYKMERKYSKGFQVEGFEFRFGFWRNNLYDYRLKEILVLNSILI